MANDYWNDELFCVLKLWDKTIRCVFDQLRTTIHPSGPNSKTLRKKKKNLARTGGETWDKISAVNICGVSPSEEQSCHILNKICVRELETLLLSAFIQTRRVACCYRLSEFSLLSSKYDGWFYCGTVTRHVVEMWTFKVSPKKVLW